MTTTISGDTGCSNVQPGSIVQADLAANVAATGPCFSVYPSVPQSMAAATDTKVLFQSKEFDPVSAFDSGANSRFQPSVAGYYQLIGNVQWNSASTLYLSVVKNGVRYKTGPVVTSATSVGVSILVYLNGTTDYVELFGYTALAQSTLAIQTVSYFQGFLARAA